MLRNASYIDFLKKQLEIRQEKNPKYSIRAMARDIGIDAADLVNILNNKKQVTTKVAYKTGRHFKMSDKELIDFIRLTLDEEE